MVNSIKTNCFLSSSNESNRDTAQESKKETKRHKVPTKVQLSSKKMLQCAANERTTEEFLRFHERHKHSLFLSDDAESGSIDSFFTTIRHSTSLTNML